MGSLRTALSILVALGAGVSLATSSASLAASAQSDSKKQSETVTLTGCLQRDALSPSGLTLADTKGQRFHLSGLSVRKYLGRPVEVDGGVVVKGVRIKGGLLPNPNVAGQAGAIDPTQAAIAGAAGSAPVGSFDIQEFKVKTVRPGMGSCP